jgi:DTW domain-containing protein
MASGIDHIDVMVSAHPVAAPEDCPRCAKPVALCICDNITPIDNAIVLLILQHPQEQDRTLGTGRLTALQFRHATLRVGLSWASLAHALGKPADPRRWVVLYLGSAKPAALLPGRKVVALDRRGAGLGDQEQALAGIEGVILLDGSWSQAKTLWWRNPWLLKCRRVALNRPRPSGYGKLRREARREGLSTIEAAALLLSRLEGRPEIEAIVAASFARLLERYREWSKGAAFAAPPLT